MNKYQLQSKIKSTAVAYLFWFLLGAHYAYLGKWGIQIIFWLTFGGVGIWWLVDLFLIPGKVEAYNLPIYHQLEEMDRQREAILAT